MKFLIVCLIFTQVYLYGNEKVTFDGFLIMVNPKKKVLQIATNKEKLKETSQTVKFSDKTLIEEKVLQTNLEGLLGKTLPVTLHGVNNTEVLKKSSPFICKEVTVFVNRELDSSLPEKMVCLNGKLKILTISSGEFEVNNTKFLINLTEACLVHIVDKVNIEKFTFDEWRVTAIGQQSDSFLSAEELIFESLEKDDPKLPRVLIIGDSISMNYHEVAKKALKGVANFHRIPENGGATSNGLEKIEKWLGDYKLSGRQWDVIQFNHGLHDLRSTYDKGSKTWGAHQIEIEDYKKNLEGIIQLLKKSGAQLIWCSTTPVPNDIIGQYSRKKEDAELYNKAALEVLKKYPEIQINDLNSEVNKSSVFDSWRKTFDVHFYKQEEKQFLGEKVSEAIKKALEIRKQNK